MGIELGFSRTLGCEILFLLGKTGLWEGWEDADGEM
jgi:hypothetical protein